MSKLAGAGRPPDSEMPDLRTPPTLPTNARLIFRRHVKGGGKQGGVPGVPGDGDGQLPSRKWCQPTTGQPYKTSHIQNGSSKKIDFCRSFEFQTASF